MLLWDGPLTLREFAAGEKVPLAFVFREVLSYFVGREDAVLVGSHAVNAYCEPTRMTDDVDVLSTRAAGLAEELRAHLAERFELAMRVREPAVGGWFRVYQARKPKNRYLIDVRQVEHLPEYRLVDGVKVVAPAELMVLKAMSIARRAGQVKVFTDRVDLARLLSAFPELRSNEEGIAERLRLLDAPAEALDAWRRAVAEKLDGDDEEVDDA